MKYKYQKYIRKYLGCELERAKEIAREYEDKTFEELMKYLKYWKSELDKEGYSKNNNKMR